MKGGLGVNDNLDTRSAPKKVTRGCAGGDGNGDGNGDGTYLGGSVDGDDFG